MTMSRTLSILRNQQAKLDEESSSLSHATTRSLLTKKKFILNYIINSCKNSTVNYLQKLFASSFSRD